MKNNNVLKFEMIENKKEYKVVGTECDNITNIIIPSTYRGFPVTTIKDYAFWCCNSIKTITIPNSITFIGSGAFGCCTLLENIIIPDNVTFIGEDAFWGCSSLTNVKIGNNVSYIGRNAFEKCDKLTNFNIDINTIVKIFKEKMGLTLNSDFLKIF